jgi:cytidylate kinase
MRHEVDMNHQSSSKHVSESSMSQLVEKACGHWKAMRQAAATTSGLVPSIPRAFTVALSREAGTQGTTVARGVGSLLGWNVYDHELLERVAQDMGLRARLLESVDEREQSWLLETAEAFLSAPRKGDWGSLVTESGYLHHLVKIVLALGIHGECVIVGRGAAFILPAATTLRVRLVGPVQERTASLSRTLAISEREAAERVRTLDRARTAFVRDHFLKDPSDRTLYDLILNVVHFSEAGCASVIVEALRKRQQRAEEGMLAKPHT